MTDNSTVRDSSLKQRRPPAAVKILLPVWGYRFTNQFLEYCLPTLLAPGNIPALAQTLPCEFCLMASSADVPIIKENPAWLKLQSICPAKIEIIDDLITDGNHSTTITLAYTRAVRASGQGMLDTCFIILCADYLFADGSLSNVLKHMQSGISGLLAGNFQIVAEDALQSLRSKQDSARVELRLSARELVKIGIRYLHPATLANVVNFGLSHNDSPNRLFWRVDDSTLFGRFYLMHPICVRPERTDFVVGSSFDYSFIPEMCPSNNVMVFTDSDDYLVLEIQRRAHEASHLYPGPIDPRILAKSLLEWTTARHRENVQHSVIFHADRIPSSLDAVNSEADKFIGQVTAALNGPPKPHLNHPYWIGAIIAHRWATGHAVDPNVMKAELHRRQGGQQGRLRAFLWRLRMFLFGTFPDLSGCHPHWPDFHVPIKELERQFKKKCRALIVSPSLNTYMQWLTQKSPTSISMECAQLLNMPDPQYRQLFGAFDCCLVHLTERELKRGDMFIDRVAPLLKPNGVFYLLVINTRFDEMAEFRQSFAYHSVRFGNFALWLNDIRFVTASKWRSYVQRKIVDMGQMALRRRFFGLPLAAALGPPLLVASYIGNRFAAHGASAMTTHGNFSSVCMEMRPTGRTSDGWQPRFVNAWDITRAESGRFAREGEIHLTNSNALPAKSDRALLTALARYRFAARMLAGEERVCQIGINRSVAPDVVRVEVGALTVYFDKASAMAGLPVKFHADSLIAVELHDLRGERLPMTYDAIYSFDALERIAPHQQEDFLRHMRESLKNDSSTVIVGCPARSAMLSRTDGIYGRTGSELRSLMLQHFGTALMFSMVEDEIHAGLVPSANYYLAVASGHHA